MYCNTIMCSRHVSCDTPQFNMRIPDSIIPKHEGVWGMQIQFHVLLPRLVQAWDSHECIHTSRAMNVASSRGMFAVAVARGVGRGTPTSWALRTVFRIDRLEHLKRLENLRFQNRPYSLQSGLDITSRYNIYCKCFSDLNFVSISRLFPVRAVCPTNLLFIYLVTLIIFSKV